MKLAVLGPLVLLAACYMRGAAGAGVTPDDAAEWGCTIDAIRQGADSMKAKDGEERLPKEGWTACDVMASVGSPDSTAIARSGGETTATWCYANGAGMIVRQVVLLKRGERWIVQAATRWHEISVAPC